jgi:hypothetical protein
MTLACGGEIQVLIRRVGFGVGVYVDRLRGDYGRNGVLIDDLRHRISEQDHILIEGFDVPLQFDAIDEKDKNGNALFT